MLELPEANAHGPPAAPAVEAGETDAELALSILLALVLPLQFSIIQPVVASEIAIVWSVQLYSQLYSLVHYNSGISPLFARVDIFSPPS